MGDLYCNAWRRLHVMRMVPWETGCPHPSLCKQSVYILLPCSTLWYVSAYQALGAAVARAGEASSIIFLRIKFWGLLLCTSEEFSLIPAEVLPLAWGLRWNCSTTFKESGKGTLLKIALGTALGGDAVLMCGSGTFNPKIEIGWWLHKKQVIYF